MLQEFEKDLILRALPGVAFRCSATWPWAADYVSPGIESLCSYTPEDLTSGRVVMPQLIHPDDLAATTAALERAIAERQPFAATFRLIDPHFPERWVLSRGQAIYEEDGTATGLVGFIVDISEQKQVEERLRESEAHHRAALELNPQIAWSTDARGNPIDVSSGWAAFIGETRAAEIGAYWSNAIHPDDRDEAIRAWTACLESGMTLDSRYRLQRSDGSYRWVRAWGAPRRGGQGAILRWYGTIQDVHEQVQIQRELEEAERRYALAAHATGDIIWDWDLETGAVRRIGYDNGMLGCSGPEFESSMSWWESRVHPDEVERVNAGMWNLIAGNGDRWSGEYRFRRPDGSYAHFLDRAFLVRTAAGEPRRLVGAMQDISDRIAAEEKVRALQAELIQMTGIGAMDTMATTLAHELNQPLAAAANYLVAARRLLGTLTGSAKSVAEEGLREAEAQIHRAGEIIRRVRGMVSNRAARHETVSLEATVGRVMTLLKASRACSAVRIRTQIPPELDRVRADPVQLEQVMLNLVRNACDATPDGSEPKLVISARAFDDGFVEIRVKDQGKGISPDALARLFTAFAESTTGGLGVGLSLCRTIVESHGGQISAENNCGRGATIVFTLPGAAPVVARRRRSASPLRAPA